MKKSIAQKSRNCRNCSERIYAGERCYTRESGNKTLTYCRFCGEESMEREEPEDRERLAEREREKYAAYMAAGCRHLYFEEN